MDDANPNLLARIERERLRLLVDADIDRAAAFHADDFQLITASGRPLSKGGYLERIRSGRIDYRRWEAGDIVVRAYGDAAVLRYPAEMVLASGDPVADASPVVLRLWHTDLYEFRDGRWQIVWSQATEIDE
ncbi:MAG TPA: nuclear transport factor 2 family protein [Candidatus Limnocylindrales bacterium]